MINKGIWPTMITPLTVDKKIDYKATEKLIEWYIEEGVDGIFAVCQSSEMIHLSLEERVELSKFVVEKVNGRVSVVSSGHISDSMEDQIIEMNLIAETGVDAIVLITNRLAKEGESEEVVKNNLEILLENLPSDIEIGFYECPLPYKRLISPKLVEWLAKQGRFSFIKETSCDIDMIKEKLKAAEGSKIKIFNANAATLLDSLRLGAYGYNGVMANFHPKLYKKMYNLIGKDDKKAEELMEFLTMASLIENQNYPRNAKYCLNLNGVEMTTVSRNSGNDLTKSQKLEVEAFNRVSKRFL
jgi:4-hydroxy-tetrahydrodipicolinate synthase